MDDLVAGLDVAQVECLEVVARQLAQAKAIGSTGTMEIEINLSQGSPGDMYISLRERVRSARRRKVRSSGR